MLYRLFSISLFFPAILIAFENDDLEKEIQKAKEVYAQDVEKARTILLEKLEFQIKKYAKTGNLELVQKLVADKKEFEANDSRVPVSAEFKTDVSEYQQKIKKSREELGVIYSKGVKEYTKQLKLDDASRLKLEMEDISKGVKKLIPMTKSTKSETKKEVKEKSITFKGRISLLCATKDKKTYLAWSQTRVFPSSLMANINEQQADSVTFEVVPGLADNNSVSIMIVPRGTRKNYLVLGKDEKLEIDNFERKQSYFERSTFRIVKGLLNGNGVSLKAFGKDKYITKRENDFVLDVNDGTDEFARNSTFLIQPGIFKGKPR